MSLRPDFAQHYGRWALVTGAAQGIGAVYAARLAALGMPLVLVDVQQDVLERQAESLRVAHRGLEVRALPVDLSDVAALNAALDSIEDLEIGLLVANAGIGAVGLWLDVGIDTKLNQVAVNCASVVVLADRLTRKMVQRRRGGVIIMASGAADMGSSFIAVYAATKAFDRVFAEGLWSELRPYGIDVTAVMPGATQTPGFDAALPPGHGPTKAMRPGDPGEVVDAALEGLGTKINVKPGSGPSRVIGTVIIKVLPRKVMLRLGDKAVRAMYDRK